MLRIASRLPALRAAGGHFRGLGPAGRAPQDGVGLFHRLDGIRRQHLAGRQIGNEAVLRLAQHHRHAAFGREPVQHAMRLRRHLGADAFAADHGDLDHVGQAVHACFPAKWIQGRCVAVGGLEGPDFVVALQRQRDLVEALRAGRRGGADRSRNDAACRTAK